MRNALVLVAVCAAAAGLSASGGPPVDVAARAKGAARVVVATVSEVRPRFDVNEFGDHIIVSQAWVEVEESLKGQPTQSVPVDIEGGTIGALTLNVSDMPTLREGDRAVFFLNAIVSNSGAHRLHRRGLGVLKLDRT